MKEQEIRKSLAGKLREFRLRAGLTTKEVGEKIGKSAKTVSGWEHERGQPDADMLFRLCEIYQIESIAEFYPDEQPIQQDILSPIEKELISLFRSMNDDGRKMLLNTARAFAGNPEMQEGPIQKKEIS